MLLIKFHLRLVGGEIVIMLTFIFRKEAASIVKNLKYPNALSLLVRKWSFATVFIISMFITEDHKTGVGAVIWAEANAVSMEELSFVDLSVGSGTSIVLFGNVYNKLV